MNVREINYLKLNIAHGHYLIEMKKKTITLARSVIEVQTKPVLVAEWSRHSLIKRAWVQF